MKLRLMLFLVCTFVYAPQYANAKLAGGIVGSKKDMVKGAVFCEVTGDYVPVKDGETVGDAEISAAFQDSRNNSARNPNSKGTDAI